jgi:hypothetical protein
LRDLVGNRASIGGTLDFFQQVGGANPEQYHGWLMFVEDSGNQHDTRDRISYQYIYVNPVTSCPNPTATSAFFELTEGNLKITQRQ